MVRSLLMLVFVFGAVTFAFVKHLSRRAVQAGKEASDLLKETGSVKETARRLYAQETMPQEIRLSAGQREHLNKNFDEFLSIYGPAIRDWVEKLTTDSAARRERDEISQDQYEQIKADMFALAMRKFARDWCELSRIA